MFGKTAKRDRIFRKLADERPLMSQVEKELISAGREFEYDRCNLVSLYFDHGNRVVSDDGLQVAYRAVTLRGELLWLVFTAGKPRGYHSEADDPFEAFEESRHALVRRRMVLAGWADVEALAWRLRLGLTRMEVLRSDAEASPLCSLGIRHFLRLVGRPNAGKMSGFMLAWMMRFEPQLGFAIHQAAVRQNMLTARTHRKAGGLTGAETIS